MGPYCSSMWVMIWRWIPFLGEISGTPPPWEHVVLDKKFRGFPWTVFNVPGCVEKYMIRSVCQKNIFLKHFFSRDIFFTWRFFRPCLNHIRKVKVFPKNLKNRKVNFLLMKNPSFQNLIHKSLRNALKLVRVDFDRNRSSYGREKDPDMKFSVCLSIYLGKSHFPK